MAGVPLPGIEIGIALSAIVLGGMVALAAQPPLWVAGVLVAALSRKGHGPAAVASALREASAAAALTCTTLGAQNSIPEAAAVQRFLSEHPSDDPGSVETLRQFCLAAPAA